MSQGVPTLVSNTSCLPEICEDAALYCDPHDPAEIARKLHDLCSDAALRENLRERGFERVTRFSWESCARDYLAALDSCLPA
jgi:glycosyltransferase involved in cell wall biosynthesis